MNAVEHRHVQLTQMALEFGHHRRDASARSVAISRRFSPRSSDATYELARTGAEVDGGWEAEL
jgi:hypothetical protein